MIVIAVAAALMLSTWPAQVASQQLPDEMVGPFRVSSETLPAHGFPYPVDHKTVTLAWASSDGASRFSLVDDGEGLRASFEDRHGGSFRCALTSPHLRLGMPVRSYFRVLTTGGCSKVGALGKAALRREVRGAAPFMEAAFARFRAASVALHGPFERRCVEYVLGNHGPICSRYLGKRK